MILLLSSQFDLFLIEGEIKMKEYKCECGQIFNDPQKFNGHKSHCRIHLGEDRYEQRKQNLILCGNYGRQQGEIIHQKWIEEQQDKLDQWISEQHTCEKCGKVMTEKYGSGRFCSKKCSSSRLNPLSIETKKILSQKAHDNNLEKSSRKKQEYLKNPNYCAICGKPLDYYHRNYKTCSAKCKNMKLSINMISRLEHKTTSHAGQGYKYGWYCGVPCDSSWELAFLLWALDHELNIVRNKDRFTYQYNGMKSYIPDFIIDGVYIEVKNYYSDKVEAKITQFPTDKTLFVIDSNKVFPYLSYAINMYGKDFVTLYDRQYPSWMDDTQDG